MADNRDTPEGFVAWLMKQATHASWKAKVPALAVLGYLGVVGFYWTAGLIYDNRDKAAWLLGPLLQLANVPLDFAPLILALIAVALVLAVVIWAWRRITAIGRRAYVGAEAAKYLMSETDEMKSLMKEMVADAEAQAKRTSARLDRIERKLGLDIPDMVPKFLRDTLVGLRGPSPVAYRYTGGTGGEYYMGIPARDLTEDDYAVLSAENQQLVDNGKLYAHVNPSAGD